MIAVDKKSKILLAVFLLLLLGSVLFTYYRTMILLDYEIIIEEPVLE